MESPRPSAGGGADSSARRLRRVVLAWAIALAVAPAVYGSGPEGGEIDFVRDVRPIFEEHCYECHGPDKRKGGLRLTNRRDAFQPGDLGFPVIEPSSAELSPLYELLVSEDAEERMPKDEDPLPAAKVEILRRWIDQGAVWPDGVDEGEAHWSYQRPTRPPRPEVGDGSWPANEIDAFVLARLESEGLSPSPEADRVTLIRRVSLDLVGLPPTPEEVEQFLNDSAPDAYERLVDRLLAKPQFGERWASLWLDLARYADSVGFQSDLLHVNWPYRDWVVDAMNDDMPFDQFTIEQLAGDLLPEPTIDQRIATGFHRAAPLNLEAGIHAEESRVQQVMDRVNTTGTVWLGSTIECAQCHNHKYDPITQEEYYRLYAFFNNTPIESISLGPVAHRPGGPVVNVPMSEEQSEELRVLLQRVEEIVRRGGGLKEYDDQMREFYRRSFLRGLADGNIKTSLGIAVGLLRLAAQDEAKPGDFEAWWARMASAVQAGAPRWQPLEITSFETTGDEEHEVLEDGSVLLRGALPDTTTYTIRTRTDLSGITGFRLEALPHRTLPGRGPGRGDEAEPDFVLSEFRVEIEDEATGDSTPVTLWAPRASRQTKEGRIVEALDEDYETGWIIPGPFGRKVYARFRVEEKIGEPGEVTRLRFTLDQNAGFGRTIGRVRLLATTAPPEIVSAGLVARKLLQENARLPERRGELLEKAFLASMRRVERRELREVSRAAEHLLPDTALVMVEEDEVRTTHLLKRGNYLDPGAEVSPGTPAVLHPMRSELPQNRLGLAKWLVDPANPLLARAVVNRWWGELFGRPLVTTPEDFGAQGERPSHPELLDWLAVELVEGGWSRKALMKKMVTSATYRQSSAMRDPELLGRDPENQLLARGARRRLPAELVRDNALAVGGLLSLRRGGPPVYPPQPEGVWKLTGSFQPRYVNSSGEDRYRRGLYTVWRRSSPYPSFMNFDAKDRSSCTVERSITNTPLQALTLLNDEVYVEAALGLARRVIEERPDASVGERLRYGFELSTTRVPTEAELDVLKALYDDQRARLEADPALSDEVLRAFSLPSRMEKIELATWFFVANALLNLDETIHRG